MKLLLLDSTGGALGLLAQKILLGFDKNLVISCAAFSWEGADTEEASALLSSSPFLVHELQEQGLSLTSLLSAKERASGSWDYVLLLSPCPLESLERFFQNHSQQRSLLLLPPLHASQDARHDFYQALEQLRSKLRAFYLKELLSEISCSCGAHSVCRCS